MNIIIDQVETIVIQIILLSSLLLKLQTKFIHTKLQTNSSGHQEFWFHRLVVVKNKLSHAIPGHMSSRFSSSGLLKFVFFLKKSRQFLECVLVTPSNLLNLSNQTDSAVSRYRGYTRCNYNQKQKIGGIISQHVIFIKSKDPVSEELIKIK